MNNFLPEGFSIESQENKLSLINESSLLLAKSMNKILEAKAIICDQDHNLIVDLNCMEGFIPREEVSIGIKEGTTKDIAIISRVNKPVCFIINSFEKKKKRKYSRYSFTENSTRNVYKSKNIKITSRGCY